MCIIPKHLLQARQGYEVKGKLGASAWVVRLWLGETWTNWNYWYSVCSAAALISSHLLSTYSLTSCDTGRTHFKVARQAHLPKTAGAWLTWLTAVSLHSVLTAVQLHAGTNLWDAQQTVDSILEDFPPANLPQPLLQDDDLRVVLHRQGVQFVDLQGYLNIDTHEVQQGQKAGKPREKLVRKDEMLRIATCN